MTGDSETRTYLVGLEQYWAAAERGENDGSSPPRPQNRDVAWRSPHSARSPLRRFSEAQLEAAALIHRQQERDTR